MLNRQMLPETGWIETPVFCPSVLWCQAVQLQHGKHFFTSFKKSQLKPVDCKTSNWIAHLLMQTYITQFPSISHHQFASKCEQRSAEGGPISRGLESIGRKLPGISEYSEGPCNLKCSTIIHYLLLYLLSLPDITLSFMFVCLGLERSLGFPR